MRWTDLEADAPALAELAERLLITPGVVLVVTNRRDGAPRLSATEPLLWQGDLWLSMLWGSYKAADLRRDPSFLLHNIVTGPSGEPGELKIRARALETDDEPTAQAYARQASARLGWTPVAGHFHLFRVELDDVTFIRYAEESGDQFVTRWPDAREYVRRATTPTSLGPPEPIRALL